jgi:hypothetical protein
MTRYNTSVHQGWFRDQREALASLNPLKHKWAVTHKSDPDATTGLTYYIIKLYREIL